MRLWDLAASLAAGGSDEVGASWGRTVVPDEAGGVDRWWFGRVSGGWRLNK